MNMRRYASGFSLIEMMISLTLGLLILSALTGVLLSSNDSSRSNEQLSEVQANGRYALDLLKKDIRQAGYLGFTWAEPTPAATAIAVTDECLSTGAAAGSFVSNIRQGLWGSNDANPFAGGAFNCLGKYLRGDVLVIRRLASRAETDCSVNPASGANTVRVRSTYAAGQLYQGTVPPAITGTPCGDFPLEVLVYYIGSDDNDASVPALRRVVLQPDGSMVDQEVVPGIEQMQFKFGRSTTDLTTRYYNANEITGSEVNTAPSDWDDVNVVRIWLLARNSQLEANLSNTQTYSLGDVDYVVNETGSSYRRQPFTTAVHLRNR